MFSGDSRVLFRLIISSTSGAAYAFVIGVMLFVFAAVSALFYIADNDTKLAAAYAHNLSGYEAACSGIYYAADSITAALQSNDELFEDILNEILAMPLNDIAEPPPENGGPPDVLYLKQTNGICLYHKRFCELAFETLPAVAVYEYSVRYASGAYETVYNVTIDVTKNANGTLSFYATAENERTLVRDRARAETEFGICDIERIVINPSGGVSLYLNSRSPELVITKLRRV